MTKERQWLLSIRVREAVEKLESEYRALGVKTSIHFHISDIEKRCHISIKSKDWMEKHRVIRDTLDDMVKYFGLRVEHGKYIIGGGTSTIHDIRPFRQ